MASQFTRQEKFKSAVWSVAIAAVICVGTITGAQLKTDKQKEESINQFRATLPEEQIAVLQAQKDHLLQHKAGLERKRDVFKEVVKERNDKNDRKE